MKGKKKKSNTTKTNYNQFLCETNLYSIKKAIMYVKDQKISE